MLDLFRLIYHYIAEFVFWYPVIMSITWIIGGLWFYSRRERRPMPELEETPMVSILIPCYNEEKTIDDTIKEIHDLNYPDYEIIAINDGSKDKTSERLQYLVQKYEKLRVIDLKTNRGKANALYLGLIASKGEILVTIDADAYLDKNALNHLVVHFVTPNFGERVGAVTGNPKIRNRSSLLAKIQVCEFASIIGLIKRAQRVLGKVMTVSGVVVAFRKRALLDCGMWDRDMITEDIAVTWKLERRFWDIRYEPKAICWMLVPESISGLWKQRVRWAQGGLEVMFRHYDIFKDWRQRRLFPVFFEQFLSVFWAVSWFVLTVHFSYNMITNRYFDFPFLWTGLFISVISLLQSLIAILLESKYDKKFLRYYLWAVWYPFVYWIFNALAILRAIPKVLFKKKGQKFAVWESPDRGLGEIK